MQTEIEKAAERLEAAKATENAARLARIRAEEELLLLVPASVRTTKTAGWRITIETPDYVHIDTAALESVRAVMPPALFEQAIRYKPDTIAAGLKYLRANEPAAYAQLAQALTIKPGKTQVKVERVERQEEAA